MNEELQVWQENACIGDAYISLYRIDFPKNHSDLLFSSVVPPYHCHFYYEIHIITAGTAEIVTEHQRNYINCGEIFIIPPHRTHLAVTHESTSSQNIVLCLTIEHCEGDEGFYDYFCKSLEDNACKPIPLSPELLYQTISLHAYLRSSQFRDLCMRRMLVYDILISLFDRLNGLQNNLFHPPDENSDMRVKLELENCISNEKRMPLSEIADKLGYSARHTARLIERLYGKSLQEIRRENSIATVKQMLAEEYDTPLHTIAEKAGFSSIYAMNRTFREMVGITPSEYRNKQNENYTIQMKGKKT